MAGVTRWLGAHWRAARVICLDFQGYPADGDWAAGQPAAAASADRVRVLRVTCSRAPRNPSCYADWHDVAGVDPAPGLPGWVARVLPLCPNLVTLHLRRVELGGVPALPLLKHLVLEYTMFQPALVASLQGLARLETLHVTGHWAAQAWDMRACTRLRRVYLSAGLTRSLREGDCDLRFQPACTMDLDFERLAGMEAMSPRWLLQYGQHIVDLRLLGCGSDVPAWCSILHAPQLSQLRLVTLIARREDTQPRCLCVAGLLGGLPQCVESLHLDFPSLMSEQAVVAVPASLRTLRIRALCDGILSNNTCDCPPHLRLQDLTFGLHVGLERLSLVLWGARVGLQCLGARTPAGLQELHVQARVVDVDAQLAAEVAQRGWVLECCNVVDSTWVNSGSLGAKILPAVRVMQLRQGPVHM